ncbi:MAG: TetR family transcriptional regulator [Rhodospirillaceae bacterium]|nr:TetR family transcriptional regulator [Rhodospirillaceae bacterium]MBL6941929.1 TetR family transcriptional regulator [Rhodospirillales bacterium]
MKRVSTRQAILTTATDLFNDQGTAAVSTNHIAEAMGISPGNLYYHFANKEEIIRHIHQQMVADMDTVWQAGDDSLPALEKFLAALAALQGMLVRYQFFQKELSVLLVNDPELAKACKKVRKARLKEIEAFFEYLIESGVMRRPQDKKTLPRLIRIGWLIGDYWLDFLSIEGEPLNDKNIGAGIDLIREIIRPYLIKG